MPIARADRIVIGRDFVATTAEEVFLKYRAELIEDIKGSLVRVKRDTPGDLLQSVDAFVEFKAGSLSFKLVMNDYWKFVDEGVNGTQVNVGSQYNFKKSGKRIPIDPIKKFIASHGYAPNNLKKVNTTGKKVSRKSKQISRAKAFESFAFAIGVNLKKRGFKPTHFFTDIINDDLKQRLQNDITKALGRDIELSFTTE